MQHPKAAVFIILGQSNAVGHGIPMKEKDIIRVPLQNAFGLSRKENQAQDNTALIWSGYTSFGMNLGETQDNTYSIPNCLAALWQKHIDEGNRNNLPNLHIIQIAVGAQGVTEGYMWHPDRPMKLIPGPLNTVDISLFPYTEHILSLLEASFAEQNTEYEIIGLHWRGGENDVTASEKYLTKNLEPIYDRIIHTFNSTLQTPPIVLHRLVCPDRMKEVDPSGRAVKKMEMINGIFEALEKKHRNITVFDPRKAPQFIPNVRGNGLFINDAVHFTPDVNRWIAASILRKYIEDKH